jgi:hypothetical protein
LGVAPEPGSPTDRAVRIVMGFGLRAPKVPGLFSGPRR